MAKRLAMLFALAVTQPSTAALAQTFELRWNDIQTATMIGGGVPLNKAGTVDLEGYFMTFWIPGNGTTMTFLYLGPGFKVNDWLFVSPEIGLAGNWVDGNKAAIMLSNQAMVNFLDGQIDGFFEADVLLYPGQIDYYGFYKLNWNPTDFLNVGAHVEQINLEFGFGPHVGIKKGPWRLEVQHFTDLTLQGHGVRIVNKLLFF